MEPTEDIILSYQQGYVAGIYGCRYNVPRPFCDYDIENIQPKIKETIISSYGSKISKFFTKEQILEFKHALDIGIHNSLYSQIYEDTATNCSLRFFKNICKTEKYKEYKQLITTCGYKIGEIKCYYAWSIPAFHVEKEMKNGCDKCGFSKWCHCFSFTDGYKMLGSTNDHYSTNVCVDCGKFSKDIYYKTNYRCKECLYEFKENNISRELYIKNNRYRQTYYKLNLKLG